MLLFSIYADLLSHNRFNLLRTDVCFWIWTRLAVCSCKFPWNFYVIHNFYFIHNSPWSSSYWIWIRLAVLLMFTLLAGFFHVNDWLPVSSGLCLILDSELIWEWNSSSNSKFSEYSHVLFSVFSLLRCRFCFSVLYLGCACSAEILSHWCGLTVSFRSNVYVFCFYWFSNFSPDFACTCWLLEYFRVLPVHPISLESIQ